ncbi:hypothetical protein [Nocardia crassostreae]|uniref:hypothetical protein n=1 Tax=Nocardia crassostreae TaxID=53428 RepID=UPI00082FCD9B|nr:hypothetical protein [Nocardia crassostreae]
MLVEEAEAGLGDVLRLVGATVMAGAFAWVLPFTIEERERNGTLAPLVITVVLGLLCVVLAIGSAASLAGHRKAKEHNQRARGVWNTPYYRHRDDVVYIPGDAAGCVPSEQMATLLRRS